MPLQICSVKRFAQLFSQHLERIVQQNPKYQVSFGPYPLGGCKQSSRLLCRALANRGLDSTYVVAHRTDNETVEHAWLEVSDGWIVDLTCAQFAGDYEGECPCVEEQSAWHDSHWTTIRRLEAIDVETAYEGLLAQLEAELADTPAKLE